MDHPTYRHYHSQIEKLHAPTTQRRPHCKELHVYAGTVLIDKIGTTACVVLYDNQVSHRKQYIHGQVVGTTRPVYRDEVAVLHNLRTLHDWLQRTQIPQEKLHRITIFASDYQQMCALKRLFATGTPTLQSAAASPLG